MTAKSANGKNRKSEAPEAGVMGRPRKEIDFEQLEQCVHLQATEEECAKILGVSADTLWRRLKEERGQTFAEYFKEHAPFGIMSLRRKVWEMGMKKENVPILQMMAKTYLGMTDKVDATIRGTGPNGSHLITDWSNLSSETLLELKANSVIATDDEPSGV